MAPTILTISSSIIYPAAVGLTDNAVSITIHPPSSHSFTPKPRVPLKLGPNHPLYRLPQSLSSGGLKVHLNEYVPSRASARSLNRQNKNSAIDEDNIIYEIAKMSIGERDAEYSIENFRADEEGGNAGGYGRGTVKFVPGWFSGGTWEVVYVYKKPGYAQEHRVELKCDEGGVKDGVWKMTFPMEGDVAKEGVIRVEDGSPENGRTIEVKEGSPGLEGWSEDQWRDFVATCWCVKVWRECTRTPLFSASARKSEAGALGRW